MQDNQQDSKNKASQKVKKKGPIRSEAIVTAVVVLGLLGLYSHFFFDTHLRKGLEWTGSYVHGAEVNINDLKSSLWGGYLEIRGIQVTDKNKPEQNLIELGKIRFELLWDALLRAKFVVNQANLTQIAINSPRQKAGWVRPPSTEPEGKSGIEKLEAAALGQLQADNSQNVLGDLAQVAGGVDEKEVLKSIQGQLKAEKRIDELQAALKSKEAEWKKRFDELPNKEALNQLSAQAKGLKFDSKDPRGFAKDLKTLKEIVKQADSKVKEFKTTGGALKADIGGFNKDISSVDDWIKQDIQDIENRLNIPKLDGASFSKSLFMKLIADKVVGFQKYAAVAREYMPPKKSAEDKDETIVPHKRGEGMNVRFPRTVGYPMFWLKSLEISSKSTADGFSGDIEGRLTDLTNNQPLINKPTLLSFKGAFPHQGVSGVKGLVTADHRVEPPIDKMDLRVGAFPVKNLKLSDSSDVQLSLNQAQGQSTIEAELVDQKVHLKMWNVFTQPDYALKAESKIVNEVLASVLQGLNRIELDVIAMGSLGDVDLDIDSNLGKELSRGFSKYFKEKTQAIKSQIKSQIENKIGDKKDKLKGDFSNLKSSFESKIKGKENEIDQAKNAVKESGENKSASSKQNAKDSLKEKGKELLKKLKF